MLRRLRDAQLGQAQLHHPPVGWSTTLVKRLKLERTLEGHDGCVNTVHFSPDGQLLVSGSDDMQICFWDWQLGSKVLQFHSGHHNNVFQARIMPQSANGVVVTCAADGVVRVAHVPQGAGGNAVETRRLAGHRGRAHKLSLEPDSPHCFMSCGEDGEVRHFDLREPAAGHRRLLGCRTQRGRLELNSVHCHAGSTQFCVAGGDSFVRVYDLRRVPPGSARFPIAEPVRRLAPWHLRSRGGLVTITCAVFSQSGRVLASYNDENIYCFMSEQEQLAHQQAAAGAAGGEQGTRVAPSATAQEQQLRQRRPGSSAFAGSSKRGRSGSSGGGSEDSGGAARRAAAARARSEQRHAATSAALAAAQGQRAASGAAAAAEAHASMRRRLLDAEAEDRSADPSQPLATAAAASRRADAAWLDSLPPPRSRAQQQAQQLQQQGGPQPGARAGSGEAAAAAPAGPQQTIGGRSAGDSPLGSAGSPQQHSGGSGMRTSGGGASDVCEEEANGQHQVDAGVADDLDLADALEGAEEAAGSSSEGEGEEDSSEEEVVDFEVDMEEEEEEEGWGREEEEEEEEDDGAPLLQGALVDEDDTMEAAGGRAGSAAAPANQQEGQHCDFVLQTFKGHRNYRTVKGVSYLGQHDEFVMSGSDCGHIYIWDAATGEVLAVLKGDHDTVNCLEPHPSHLLTIATSGIEDTIKLWAPTAEEPQVLGAAERRLMAENERAQGEDRRALISPAMLRVLLRARGLLPPSGSGDDEDDDSEDDSEGSDSEGGRHTGECTIS
ncbi:hypothetical protein ABPG75_013102 [Micractinium tetrahymenae]